jgi:hypothetical protein
MSDKDMQEYIEDSIKSCVGLNLPPDPILDLDRGSVRVAPLGSLKESSKGAHMREVWRKKRVDRIKTLRRDLDDAILEGDLVRCPKCERLKKKDWPCVRRCKV